jgi:hypothetical protein
MSKRSLLWFWVAAVAAHGYNSGLHRGKSFQHQSSNQYTVLRIGKFLMPSSIKGLSLFIRTADGETVTYEIQKLITRIGRDATNDLVLLYPSVSRKHAAMIIDRAQQRLYIEDLRSQNGVRVNGQIINDIAPVQVGDEITLGDDVTLTLQAHQAQMQRVQASRQEDQEMVYNFPDSE